MNRIITVCALVLLCVNPACFEGPNCMNLPLCAVLILSPLALLIKGTRVIIPRVDIPLTLVMICAILFPALFHPQTLRWITILYTCAFCIFFMMLARMVRISDLDPAILFKTVKGLVYAFLIVLIIQQVCVLLHLPIFLESLIGNRFEPFKLNSLTAEASHTTLVLSVIMMIYAQSRTYIDQNLTLTEEFKHNYLLWIAYYYVIFTTLNSSAFLMWFLPLLPFIRKRDALPTVVGIAAVILIVYASPLGEYRMMQRISKTGIAAMSLDTDKLIAADPSIAQRIVPSIWGFKAVNFTEADNYVGHGTDSVDRDFPDDLADPDGVKSAGIFTIWYNYGMFCALALWSLIFIVTVIPRQWTTWIVFLLGIQLSSNYNVQLMWMLMAFAMVYKFSICNQQRLLKPHSIRNIKTGAPYIV